ncbi:MAG: hypothetical protein DDG60_05055 [Anaerolineae bacterium]|nr:MAG: hypothetical protein DDG60_05055 [Anaerolineae bacterium]
MNWHARYRQQARWTQSLRAYLFGKAAIAANAQCLEVGCGTGALLEELSLRQETLLHGLDTNFLALREAAVHAPSAILLCADGHALPYPNGLFDLTFCHYLLLWVRDPLRVISEMRRVTRPGGVVLALAEPDYGGRIDYPPELESLGILQSQALRTQGADPEIGRKLAGLFVQAGLRQVEAGILGAEWNTLTLHAESLEWSVLASDLAEYLSPQDLQTFQHQDTTARQNGQRVLFVPTFFAWGRV